MAPHLNLTPGDVKQMMEELQMLRELVVTREYNPGIPKFGIPDQYLVPKIPGLEIINPGIFGIGIDIK
jgi:hypothetical protein